MVLLPAMLVLPQVTGVLSRPSWSRGRRSVQHITSSASSAREEYDVLVIGSGIGGLSAAAALASTGLSVAVCESHDSPGGAAHEWEVKGFHFESGPSLYAGLSPAASPNPLKHVFQIIGEEPEWITYDRWGTHLPEGSLCHDAVGSADFFRKLEAYGGPDSRQQWERLMRRVVPLGEAIFELPSAAVRSDAGVAITMGRYAPALAKVLITAGGPDGLNGPFVNLLEEEGIDDPFILNCERRRAARSLPTHCRTPPRSLTPRLRRSGAPPTLTIRLPETSQGST